MANEVMGAEILTLKEAAGYLKVTERTIYKLATAKKIPALKVGGTWRFSLADIDDWIRRQTSESSGDRSSASHGHGI